jgi:hypothetical protein
MNTDTALRSWPRNAYREGCGTPFLFYVVFGALPREGSLPAGQYRSAGLPEGLGVDILYDGIAPEMRESFLEGPAWDAIRAEDPVLARLTQSAPDCMMIHGHPRDASTLDYLRDVVGFITWLTDKGAVSIYDAQVRRWWSPADWRYELFDPGEPMAHRHVVVLLSSDAAPGSMWLHTRGLKKLGRPELSLHGVTERTRAEALALFERYIDFAAAGAALADGQEIRLPGLPAGMTAHLRGRLDDPAFDNVHLEIEWPEGG